MKAQWYKDPRYVAAGILKRLPLHWMKDETYLRMLYRVRFGKKLDLDDPRTFNEKLQWLKLHDRRPEYTVMVDKYAAKKWVADRIGEQYIIPTLGVWEHFDEIDFDRLPDQFVLKCTHDSGGLVIVKDKNSFNKKAARHKLEKCLKKNFFYPGREWPYKDIRPRIIAEPYLTDESGVELKDYKIFTFDGRPNLIQVDYDRFALHKRNLYTTDWQYIEATIQYPTDPAHQIARPENLEKMLALASALSQGYPHIRTDFYNIDGRILFGELTLNHGAGFEKFTPPELALTMGQWLRLPSGGGILKKDNIILYLRLQLQTGLPDYKIMCFNGKAKCSFVCSERYAKTGLRVTFFDDAWNVMPFERHYPKSEKPIPRPLHFEKMKQLAQVLAGDTRFLRVDFYECNAKLYCGELTLYPGGGFEEFTPPVWDMTLGSWLELPAGQREEIHGTYRLP